MNHYHHRVVGKHLLEQEWRRVCNPMLLGGVGAQLLPGGMGKTWPWPVLSLQRSGVGSGLGVARRRGGRAD